MNDHDLLIRIDERTETISKDVGQIKETQEDHGKKLSTSVSDHAACRTEMLVKSEGNKSQVKRLWIFFIAIFTAIAGAVIGHIFTNGTKGAP